MLWFITNIIVDYGSDTVCGLFSVILQSLTTKTESSRAFDKSNDPSSDLRAIKMSVF